MHESNGTEKEDEGSVRISKVFGFHNRRRMGRAVPRVMCCSCSIRFGVQESFGKVEDRGVYMVGGLG